MYVARAADFLRGVAAAFDQQCGDVQSPFVPAVCDELHGVRAEVVISVADDCDIGCRPGGVQKAFLQTALQWCVNVSTTMKVPLQELSEPMQAVCIWCELEVERLPGAGKADDKDPSAESLCDLAEQQNERFCHRFADPCCHGAGSIQQGDQRSAAHRTTLRMLSLNWHLQLFNICSLHLPGCQLAFDESLAPDGSQLRKCKERQFVREHEIYVITLVNTSNVHYDPGHDEIAQNFASLGAGFDEISET